VFRLPFSISKESKMKLKEGVNKFTVLPGTVIEHAASPELDKLHAVKDKSQACGEFVEWLGEKHGVVLAKPHIHTRFCREGESAFGPINCDARSGELVRDHVTLTKRLAEFFEIDMDKVEEEKRALLDEIRKANGGGK
jgi:hypothetical protein